ncbi:DUF262 domain-containing protein [Salibacterium salarium]|uniref:DUF262 domain-containing protein n=1 Tax=Salibacterium salarium TaxID=284579 RepID=A0A428N6I6_9BACI|nr:DUF262 domain-containing protein [Salibacterium salarium]RSL33928.1 DUF262 domain-containing protein [Salibacterium salarium]
MKASETNFLNFIQGTKQFMIPIYQRKYSWSINQCKQLWRDVLHASIDDTIRGHFVGSIVYIEKGLYHISAVPQLLVIDGQQRMTTISLLLLALAQEMEEREEKFDTTKKKILNYFLLNSDEEEDDLYYKLFLTKADRATYISLLNESEIPENRSERIYENYKFFREVIKKSGTDLNALYQGLSKLIVVDIALDRDHDNPQLIFESLNSTGLDLSQADLIRNYVLMKLEPKEQEYLYKNYWYPMEKSFGDLSDSSLFDRFMRDFLTVKTGRIPNIKNVYADFKEYVTSKPNESIEYILEDIYKYSKYFVKLAFQSENDREVNQVLKDVNSLKVDVSYPLLLEVYNDYESDLISKNELISILKLVESYVFRRAICGVPTNSLNKTFATFARDIDKNNYLESVQALFALKDSYRRFPNDEEFKRALAVKDVYNFRSRNYLLRKLENHDTKEIVDIENYTVEHIMPQNENLSKEWQQELGANWKEIQQAHLHTIGNLTLTRYNPELRDRFFKEKRDMKGGFADSPLRLNKDLKQIEHWGEDRLKERSEKLSEIAASIWQFPDISHNAMDKYKY